jgi:O-methyltransferase
VPGLCGPITAFSRTSSFRGRRGSNHRGLPGGHQLLERAGEIIWRLGLWLRRSAPIFQEERLLGRTLVRLRALWQVPLCVLREPDLRSLRKGWLCLRLAVRYTMVSPALLFRMHDIAERTADAGVEGSLVECGVWNGGSAALLAVAAQHRGGDRECWLFDSFEGLPPPTERDPDAVRSFYFEGWNRGEESRVREIWERLRLCSEHLHIQKGWFSDSFPRSAVGSIAILHIDSDWYDSVRFCLEWWYDRVQPGGAIILNDYNLYSGANEAVHDFLQGRSEGVEIRLLGRAGAWFEKPGARRKAPLDVASRVCAFVAQR